MQLIKALYPKLRIVARGNVIKVLGDEEEMCAFEENITKLEKYCAEYKFSEGGSHHRYRQRERPAG